MIIKIKQPETKQKSPPREVTKLELRDTLVAMGRALWVQVKALIESDADIKEHWELAVSIPTDAPLVLSIQAALGWSDQQRDDFLRSCKE